VLPAPTAVRFRIYAAQLADMEFAIRERESGPHEQEVLQDFAAMGEDTGLWLERYRGNQLQLDDGRNDGRMRPARSWEVKGFTWPDLPAGEGHPQAPLTLRTHVGPSGSPDASLEIRTLVTTPEALQAAASHRPSVFGFGVLLQQEINTAQAEETMRALVLELTLALPDAEACQRLGRLGEVESYDDPVYWLHSVRPA
jgi:hypothetical protein